MKKSSLTIVITTMILEQKHYVKRKQFTGDFVYVFQYTTDPSQAVDFHSYLQAEKELKWVAKSDRKHQVEEAYNQLPLMVPNSATYN